MKFRILVLFAVFAYALGQGSNTTAGPPMQSSASPTVPPATAAPTAPPITTSNNAPSTAPPPSPTSAPTAAPQTTTAPPQTTTAPPQTTTAPPQTTPAPPLSTTVAPLPTVSPTDIPDAAVVTTWYIQNSDGKYCLLFKAGIQFGIMYSNSDGVWLNATINVPKNASVAPNNCTEKGKVQDFGLTWTSAEGQNYTVDIKFSPVDDDKGYSLCFISLDFSYDAPEFVNSTLKGPGYSNNSDVSVTDYELQSLQDSYMCMEDIFVNLTKRDDAYIDTARFTKLQFLAYGDQSADDDFGYATECDADFTNSDIVPIAVGCALAALVVIVLIAYLIGRKRSRQKGYQSV